MMKIATFLRTETSGNPSKGMVGQETAWLEMCHLDLLFGKMAVVDSSYAAGGEPGSVHQLPPGRYQASVKVAEYGWDRRVSRVRIGTPDPDAGVGRSVGKAHVDSGSVVIWDAPFAGNYRMRKRSLLKSVQATHKKLWVPPKRNLCSVGRITAASGDRLIVVETGFGDGTYPIYELRRCGKRVGLEVVFIESGKPYPFEVKEPPTLDVELEADENLHWSLVKGCSDAAWSALQKGSLTAQGFFAQLSPGRGALLALRIFNMQLAHGSLYAVCLSQPSMDVVADEVLEGFKLLGAMEYAGRFQQVHSLCRAAVGIADPRARLAAIDAVFSGVNLKSLISFQDWFEEAMKDPGRRIGPFIRRYVESHPGEFTD
jgi:hypothetical protein